MTTTSLALHSKSPSIANILSIPSGALVTATIPLPPSKKEALTLPSIKKALTPIPAASEAKIKAKVTVIIPEAKKVEILKKIYLLTLDENNEIELKLDAEVRKITRVIYQFFRKTTDGEGKEIIWPLNGKTENSVSNRMSEYIRDFNDTGENRRKSRFFEDVRAYPEQFFFKIRKFVGPDEDINNAETECITEDDSVENGYNENYGGGGGNKFIPNPDVIPSTPIEPVTPEKVYPLYQKDKKSKITIQTTPTIESKVNAVYFFKHIETNRRYIGRTTSSIRERFSKHQSSFNSKKSKKPLPLAIQQSPNKFVCGVYGQFKEGENPKPHEDNCIGKKNSMVPNGYNTAKAGGGGVAKGYGKRKSTEAGVVPTGKKLEPKQHLLKLKTLNLQLNKTQIFDL